MKESLEAGKMTPATADHMVVVKMEEDYRGHKGYTKVTMHTVWPDVPQLEPIMIGEGVPLGLVEIIYNTLPPNMKVGSVYRVNMEPVEQEQSH